MVVGNITLFEKSTSYTRERRLYPARVETGVDLSSRIFVVEVLSMVMCNVS